MLSESSCFPLSSEVCWCRKNLLFTVFSAPVISPCCAGFFHNEDAVVHVISRKMQFCVTAPWAFTPPTFTEPSEPSQATEEISQQTWSDRLWSQLIFSDTWHWDPLTSTQHIQHTANGGERRAKTSNKEPHSVAMIRHCEDIGEPDYSGNELGNAANEDINRRVLRCPFSLLNFLRVHFSYSAPVLATSELRSGWDKPVTFSAFSSMTNREKGFSSFAPTWGKKRYKHIVVKVTGTYKHR